MIFTLSVSPALHLLFSIDSHLIYSILKLETRRRVQKEKKGRAQIISRTNYHKFHLSILSLMKGGISEEVLGVKNCKVSPSSGNPIEPGGSLPLHLGFLHL